MKAQHIKQKSQNQLHTQAKMADKITIIEVIKIQDGSDSKPRSPKFINYSLLINKFCCFK